MKPPTTNTQAPVVGAVALGQAAGCVECARLIVELAAAMAAIERLEAEEARLNERIKREVGMVEDMREQLAGEEALHRAEVQRLTSRRHPDREIEREYPYDRGEK